MPRRGPLSAAHKAAISAGMKRYWAGKRSTATTAAPRAFHIETGGSISREEAAARMYGTAAARKKLAARKRRSK